VSGGKAMELSIYWLQWRWFIVGHQRPWTAPTMRTTPAIIQ